VLLSILPEPFRLVDSNLRQSFFGGIISDLNWSTVAFFVSKWRRIDRRRRHRADDIALENDAPSWPFSIHIAKNGPVVERLSRFPCGSRRFLYLQRRRGDAPWAGHDNPVEGPPRLQWAGGSFNLNRFKIEGYIYEHAQSEGNSELARQR
jgi:hypothetical protein